MRQRTVQCLLALVLGLQPLLLLAEALSANEKRMIEWVDSQSNEAIDLLKETVDIPSGTLNQQGVSEVGVVLKRELDGLRFDSRWIEMPESMNRAGHLFASKQGEGKRLLLIGHLDTVFEAEDGTRAFEREDDIAHGHGVSDMKSGNVVIIYALKALQEIGALQNIPIRVAFTGDEEKPGSPLAVARADLLEAGQWADVALGFEEAVNFDGKDWATVARRSSSSWILTVTGVQAHSSGVFSESVGAGAVFETARILNTFYEQVRGEEFLTFNAGSIQGGTEIVYDPKQNRGSTFGKTNVVPRTAVVHGGIRTISDDQLERARATMRQIVVENLPRTSARIEFIDGYPAMSPSVGNLALQAQLSAINVALGRMPMPALDPVKRGAADISFVAPFTDALAGLGALGGGGHTPDEYLELSSLPLAIKRAAILMYRLSNESDSN